MLDACSFWTLASASPLQQGIIKLCLQVEAGYRSSAGVACNRMLAKLAAGLHKPDDQTVLLPCEAAAFVAGLPVRARTCSPVCWQSFVQYVHLQGLRCKCS